MMKYSKLLTLFLSLFVAQFSFAKSNQIDLNSIEKQITTKLKRTLNVFIKEKDYVINVDLKKKTLDTQSQAKLKVKSIEAPTEGDADFVLYHKLGLDPLVNYEDAPAKTNTKAAKEVLSSIKVDVMINDRLPAQTIESIKKVLNTTPFNLGVTPEFNYSKIKIEQFDPILPKEEKVEEPRDYIELASKFSTSIGFILATLILSVVALILFSKFSSLQKSQTSAMIDSNKDISQATIAANQEAQAAASTQAVGTEAAGASAEAGGATGAAEASASAVDGGQEAVQASANRFKKYHNENLNDSVTLLKKWINLKAPGSAEALMIVAQELEPEMLLKMFENLSVKERNEWKTVISSAGSNPNFQAGSNFINQQILENIIVPNEILGEKTQSLLYSLTPSACATMISENPDLGPVLMNTLASNFIVKMIPHLGSELLQELTISSVSADVNALKSLDSKLQSTLEKYVQNVAPSPFSTKITDILPFVNSSTEEHLFKAYGQTESKEKLYQIVKSHIPVSLILNADDAVLKPILQRMPKADFLNLLLVLDEDFSDKFINAFAPEGSKKREGIDFEIESLQENELHIAKIKKNKTAIEDKFIAFARRVIAATPTLLEELDESIEELCSEWTNESSERGLHAA